MTKPMPLMTRANRDLIRTGDKTMTRRVIVPQPYHSSSACPRFNDTEVGDIFVCPDMLPTSDNPGKVFVECESRGTYHYMGMVAFIEKHAPHQVGDEWWMREPYQIATCFTGHTVCGNYPDDGGIFKRELSDKEWKKWSIRKKPYAKTSSMFMYKSLAREWRKVSGVFVQQVQDISWQDCKAEGCDCDYSAGVTYKKSFQLLWDSINGTKYPWKSNPYVWAISFERIDK